MKFKVSLFVFFSFIFSGSQLKATTYTTTSFGDWSDSERWDNGLVPPSTIPQGDTVLINHNTWISSGASITNNGLLSITAELFRLNQGGIITNNGSINSLTITNFGTITNNGIIAITDKDIFNRSGALISNTNSGLILLSNAWITNASLVITQAGVFCDGNGTINNEGTICVVNGAGTGGLSETCSGGIYTGNAVQQGCQMIGVDEFDDAFSVHVFPVPANDYLNVKLKSQFDSYRMEIVDATGRLTGTYLLNKTESKISTTNWADGIYFFKLIENNGRFNFQGRFMIKH